MVIQAAPVANSSSYLQPRVGFTVSKRVGNAVKRNRARRRLKSIASDVLPKEGFQAWDYVFIGRLVTLDRPYDLLLEDARWHLGRYIKNHLKKNESNMLQLLRPAQAIFRFLHYLLFLLLKLLIQFYRLTFSSFWVMNADFSQHAQNMLSRL